MATGTALTAELVAAATQTTIFVGEMTSRGSTTEAIGNAGSNIIEVVKAQAEQNGVAFENVFNAAVEVAPDIAAQAAAKATAVVEFIGDKAPEAFEVSVDSAQDAFAAVQAAAPVVFQAAIKVGDAAANFATEHGPEVLDALKMGGKSMLALMESSGIDLDSITHFATSAAGAVSDAASGIIGGGGGGGSGGGGGDGGGGGSGGGGEDGGGDCGGDGDGGGDGGDGGGGGDDGGGGGDDGGGGGGGGGLDGIVDKAGDLVGDAGKAVTDAVSKIDVPTGAAIAVAGAAAPVASAVVAEIVTSGAGAQVLGALGSGAAAVGEAISSAVTADNLAMVGGLATTVVGTAGAAMPFLLPLTIALRDVGNAFQQASFNKDLARQLNDRCVEVGKIVMEMAPKIQKMTKSNEEAEEVLAEVVAAIKGASEFLDKFTKKFFLMKMVRWKKDGHTLALMEGNVSDALQNLSVRISGHQMDLAMADSEKLDKLFDMIATAGGGAGGVSNVSQMDPKVLAAIAKEAGCGSAEEITDELREIGLQLDDIQAAVDDVLGVVRAIDQKVDKVSDKLDQAAQRQQEADERMQRIILEGQAEAEKRDRIALNRIMQMTGARGVDKVFSKTEETLRMARRAEEVQAGGPAKSSQRYHTKIIHHTGVGSAALTPKAGKGGKSAARHAMQRQQSHRDLTDSLDGEDGVDGDNGPPVLAAMHGHNGCNPGVSAVGETHLAE